MLRLDTAGRSHGSAIVGILTGMPAGVTVDEDEIRKALAMRRAWYGRGERQGFEQDEFRIIGGVQNGLTTGAPVAIQVENVDSRDQINALTVPVPGHGDIGSAVRLNSPDFSPARERTSARETVVRVAIGVIIKAFLMDLSVSLTAHSVQVGSIVDTGPYPCSVPAIIQMRHKGLGMLRYENQAVKEVDQAIRQGLSVGGRIRLIVNGLAPGIGGYETYQERLDARLAGSLMAIPAIKAVEIGRADQMTGLWDPGLYGSVLPGAITSGLSGGIEAGMSTGGPIEVFLTIKPVSGVRHRIESQDLVSSQRTETPYIRSDTTAIGPALQVVEAQAALEIANALLKTVGSGPMGRIRESFQSYSASAKGILGCPGPIVVCGMPASGKTAVGTVLAKRLGRDFRDTDQAIEQVQGMSVADIIRKQGLAAFRKQENDVVMESLQGDSRVIALGGGALNNEVINAIHRNDGILCFLDTDIDVLVERIVQAQQRPLFDGLDRAGVLQKCRDIWDKRKSLYQQADIVVPGLPLDMVVEEVFVRIGAWRNYRAA